MSCRKEKGYGRGVRTECGSIEQAEGMQVTWRANDGPMSRKKLDFNTQVAEEPLILHPLRVGILRRGLRRFCFSRCRAG
jgi:hypothetical protein